MKKILVTGSKGQLGNEIRKLSSHFPNFQFVFTDIEELDLLDSTAVNQMIANEGFAVCLNCAAYTAVDRAEDEEEVAMKINVDAVENLAKVCEENGVFLIHVSTDYVFNGEMNRPYQETDETIPNSIYGWSKLKGEAAVFKQSSHAIIIRTSWLCSSFGNNFLKTMLKLGKERDKLGVVFDQVGTPTFAADLAKAMLIIAQQCPQKPIQEIYHFSNEGAVSWYDFAKAIMDLADLKCKVDPIESSAFPTKAKRPYYSVLNKEKIKKDYQIQIPYWRESLSETIEEILRN